MTEWGTDANRSLINLQTLATLQTLSRKPECSFLDEVQHSAQHFQAAGAANAGHLRTISPRRRQSCPARPAVWRGWPPLRQLHIAQDFKGIPGDFSGDAQKPGEGSSPKPWINVLIWHSDLRGGMAPAQTAAGTSRATPMSLLPARFSQVNTKLTFSRQESRAVFQMPRLAPRITALLPICTAAFPGRDL